MGLLNPLVWKGFLEKGIPSSLIHSLVSSTNINEGPTMEMALFQGAVQELRVCTQRTGLASSLLRIS